MVREGRRRKKLRGEGKRDEMGEGGEEEWKEGKGKRPVKLIC